MGNSPQSIDLKPDQAQALLDRIESRRLDEADYRLLGALIRTYLYLKSAFEQKTVSIRRLRRMLFGASTESAHNVLEKKAPEHKQEKEPAGSRSVPQETKAPKVKRKGHGRNGADCYTGACRVQTPHPFLKPGDKCLECPKGKVYRLKEPAVFVRLTGSAPIGATVYERERLRCNLCGMIYTAPLPDGVEGEKVDPTAGSMVVVQRYGYGIPFYRLEKLQECLGVPLPDATQWDMAEAVADKIYRAYEALVETAAQARIVHNDDSTMRVLSLMKEIAQEQAPSRTGIFTTGLLCITDQGRRIALYFTGRSHAGENLDKVLAYRSPELPPPIQMSDALSRNKPANSETIECNCLTHARRNFVDVAENFSCECAHLIESIGKVYRNESLVKEQGLSDQERLEYHRAHSGPVMEELKRWGQNLLDAHTVEPSSGLGGAIKYMLNHWEKLTAFLRILGAPLDNNICEQILKRAILHRKNSLFYRTEHGAYIGDMFMSLIQTCVLCGANPLDYLTVLQTHSSQVFKNPGKWLPWNYRQNIEPDSS
jgi:hypothetical protein